MQSACVCTKALLNALVIRGSLAGSGGQSSGGNSTAPSWLSETRSTPGQVETSPEKTALTPSRLAKWQKGPTSMVKPPPSRRCCVLSRQPTQNQPTVAMHELENLAHAQLHYGTCCGGKPFALQDSQRRWPVNPDALLSATT